MRGANRYIAVVLAFSILVLMPQPVLAYSGPGAGLELVGYFMALLAWGVVALSAVLMWPITAVMRYLRGAKRNQEAAVGRQESNACDQPTDSKPQTPES